MRICIRCAYILYTHTQEVLTILLALVINGSHFSMYIICAADAYLRINWQDFNTIQIFVL